LKRRRQGIEQLRAGAAPGLFTDEEIESMAREVEHVAGQTQHLDLPKDGEWLMSAELRRTKSTPSDRSDILSRGYAFYRGYADTGFRISRGGKRTRDGWQYPRRRMEGVSRDMRVPGVAVNVIEGQAVRPTNHVWCPICGQLNQLDWPDALKNPRAR
jgi:hypothetical protein